MYMLVTLTPPFPPGLNQSYIPFGYYNFGLCCWQYAPNPDSPNDIYDGVIEWINTAKFCTKPKYENPVSFRYLFKAGIQGIIIPQITINANIPDITINGTPYNPTNGKNMPIVLAD